MNDDAQTSAVALSVKRCGKGLCISCGVALPERTGRWPRCKPCEHRHQEHPGVAACKKRIAQRSLQRQLRLGLCHAKGCKNHPKEGKKFCQKHIDLNLAAVLRYRARKAKESA